MNAETTASLATAAGTLVLEGLRPVLVNSRFHAPPEKFSFVADPR